MQPPSRKSSFEDRMRGMLGRQDVQQRRRRPPTSIATKRSSNNLVVIDNLKDYKAVVVEAQQHNRLVCVGFFATWCKACQATVPQFARAAMEFPHVQFVHVPVSHSNVQLHQGLGVKTLPSAHIYHPQAGLVEDSIKLAAPRSRGKPHQPQVGAARHRQRGIANLKTVLQAYVQGSCELAEEERVAMRAKAGPQQSARRLQEEGVAKEMAAQP